MTAAQNLLMQLAPCILVGLIASCRATSQHQSPSTLLTVQVTSSVQSIDPAPSQTTPQPVIRVEPAVLDFGVIPTGESKTARLKLTNVGAVAYRVINRVMVRR